MFFFVQLWSENAQRWLEDEHAPAAKRERKGPSGGYRRLFRSVAVLLLQTQHCRPQRTKAERNFSPQSRILLTYELKSI